MKICTITCHDVYNYGASLQAYALQRYLQELGHQVRIIDYKPDYLSGHYRLSVANSSLVGNSKLLKLLYIMVKLPGRLLSRRRKYAFDRFRNKHLNLTPIRYTSYSELSANPPDAECYFTGSDQIWNTTRPNGNDPAFYLMFVPDGAVRASYAASIATDFILEDSKPLMQRGVAELDHVSVRESTAIGQLAELGVNEVVHVLDPVFLLPKEYWSEVAATRHDSNYVLVYDFEDSNEIKHIAMEYAKKHGIKIYGLSQGKYKYADKRFSHAGPADFLALIRNAKFVVTNSYHAIIFCIIFGVNFYTAGRTEGINIRMADLLAQFGLKMHEFINTDLVDTTIQKIVTDRLNHSKKYISMCLKSVK